ncbi:AAA family ATPase [Chitinophaga pinensis]|uniref:ATPase associated with various cellular activities AAA_5 n=1 Tax=Chitinophaga pinensis (strain ATCC 43595 / DSM 2588 / LMG 13176 / NBRC 15968 / NCIMB 11800 / UQM 2034) TaxID=485918 RepID=A0A979GSR8_CHIPD|nr:AAA family ATPase [Chitinophaga pinensis]ACU63247.1 ATPase associated with various cellular activities AAA_5 [Chitinophaga pinensis DSM 2588]
MEPLTSESPLIDKLNDVLQHMKGTFVGKDDIIDLMGICLAGRENLFLFGPPGTAKSALVRELARQLDLKTFEYLLTRFTEPNELFGPFDIRKLRDGDLVTNTEGMLPEASLVFLDELLNANSAILNSLLMALNEKIFRRAKETRILPTLTFIGASNHLPEDEALQALFDRFLIRVRCSNVDPVMLDSVLQAGWGLEQQSGHIHGGIAADELRALQHLNTTIDLNGVRPEYISLVQQLRNAGVQISDRRAVKLQRLVAASALLCKRDKAILSDLWILRYIWDTEEQIEIIAGIVNAVIAKGAHHPQEHPRADNSSTPDADALYREVEQLQQQWDHPETTAAIRAQIKDRLRSINSRCEWISNTTQRNYVLVPVDALWKKIMQSA